MAIATIEPVQVRAGTDIRWTQDYADYPPSGWTLQYVFASTKDKITVDSTDDGDGKHLLRISSATSAGLSFVDYFWSKVFIQKGSPSEKVYIGSGVMSVLPDLTDVSSYDGRSHVKKVLDAIEAVIENRATKDQESYSFAGRSLSRTPIQDLITLRNTYKGLYDAELAQVRIASGQKGSTRILARLTR